jgi:hypothetical protein
MCSLSFQIKLLIPFLNCRHMGLKSKVEGHGFRHCTTSYSLNDKACNSLDLVMLQTNFHHCTLHTNTICVHHNHCFHKIPIRTPTQTSECSSHNTNKNDFIHTNYVWNCMVRNILIPYFTQRISNWQWIFDRIPDLIILSVKMSGLLLCIQPDKFIVVAIQFCFHEAERCFFTRNRCYVYISLLNLPCMSRFLGSGRNCHHFFK